MCLVAQGQEKYFIEFINLILRPQYRIHHPSLVMTLHRIPKPKLWPKQVWSFIQECLILNGTIVDNIQNVNIMATDAQAMGADVAAQWLFNPTLKDGYHTIIGQSACHHGT